MNLLFTTIILLAFTIGCFYLVNKSEDIKFIRLLGLDFALGILGSIGVFIFIVHLFLSLTKGVDYNSLLNKRVSIINSLDKAREISNNLESAAILKEIIDFNTKIADAKYTNKTFFFGQYIDDRVEGIEPIK